MTRAFLFLFLLVVCPAQAATIYVDKDNSCDGSGITGDPYCSIALAVTNASTNDVIRIRDAASAYSETITTTKSGITVEPDTGHNPTIRNAGDGGSCATFWLQDGSNWIIRNLNFDATGANACLYGAILIHAPNNNVSGHQILNNTFKGWGESSDLVNKKGMTAIVLSGGALLENEGFWPENITIQGNTFDSNRLNNIVLTHSRNITIQNNEFKGTKCGTETDDSISLVGIKGQFDIRGIVVQDNTFHDYEAVADCDLGTSLITAYVGYYCDVRGHEVTIRRNQFYNFDQNGDPSDETKFVSGVFIEAGCESHSIYNNIFYNIKSAGIYSSYHELAGATNVYVNNSIYNSAYGFYLKEGIIDVRNNIVKKVSSAAICHGCGSGSPSLLTVTYDYNVYDDGASQTKIGLWAGVGTLNFADWKTQCSCDSHSINADPLFVNAGSGDFHLQSGSPAKNTGISIGSVTSDFSGTSRPQGAAYEIGAYEFIESQPGPPKPYIVF